MIVSIDVADFTVEMYEHGMVVIGSVPLDAMNRVKKLAQSQRWTILDAGIANYYRGACFVFTSKRGSMLWRAEIEKSLAHLSPIYRWRRGCDTGLSSWAIVTAITGQPGRVRQDLQVSIPHDIDDLGRCVRLLDSCPELRPRLHEVSDRHAEWAPLVEHWPELESLYRADDRAGVENLLARLNKEVGAKP